MSETVLENSSQINTWFERQSTILNTMAQNLQYESDYHPANLQGYLKMMKDRNPLALDYYIGFADPGESLVSGTAWIPPADYDCHTRDWYRQALEAGGLIFTTPYLDADTGKMVVTLARPLSGSSRTVGVLAVDILVTDVMDITRKVGGEGIDYAFLLDREGNFLVHPLPGLQPTRAGLKNAGRVLDSRYRSLLGINKTGKSEILKLVDYDGRKKYFIASRVKTGNWTFGVAIPQSVYLQPLNQLLIGFLIALGLALGIGLLGTMFMVNSLVKPIKMLRNAVTRFSQKDFTARAPVASTDEIGDLGSSFNEMAATIEEYNCHLEDLVAERTRELKEKNTSIMQSIDYARRIQQSILPDFNSDSNCCLDNIFVIWKPRDMVGGDFYWSKKLGEDYLIGLCDCTGHGVPGALMTMTVNAIMHRVTDEIDRQNPGRILKTINRLLKETLHQDDIHALTDDGADLALCLLKPAENKLVFASARLSLYYSHGREIREIKGDRQSLGYKKSKLDYTFTNHEINLESGQVFYLCTDGFMDQNGGEKDASFGPRRFRQMIEKSLPLPFDRQKTFFQNNLDEYMGEETQRDDISFIGFRIR